MKKLFIAVFMFVSTFATNVSADGHAIKMGIILGFTGPIESLTPAMAASAELAFKEASDSGSLLGGKTITPLRADSTCVDSAAATSAAEGLVSQGVVAIMGADCSGVTGAIASNVARTISATPESRVKPRIAPRACGSQYGAPKPVKAGTR